LFAEEMIPDVGSSSLCNIFDQAGLTERVIFNKDIILFNQEF
jgi:hypothetical protein